VVEVDGVVDGGVVDRGAVGVVAAPAGAPGTTATRSATAIAATERPRVTP
jgi:hypothetical protein